MSGELVAHVLPAWILAILGAGVVLGLVRRANGLAGPALLAAIGFGILITGSVVDTTLHVAGHPLHGGGPAHAFASAAWHVAGMALLAAGTVWSLRRRRGPDAGVTGQPFRRCSAGFLACAPCREIALMQVCASLPDGTIVGATQTFAHATGWKLTDLVGLPLDTVLALPAQIIQDHEGGVLLDEAAEPTTTRATLHLASGEDRLVLASLAEREAERGYVLTAVVQDAAPLVSAERRAHDSEALLRGVTEMAPVAILTADRAGVIQGANTAATGLFGLPRRSLIGRSMVALVERVAADPVDAERFVTRAWRDKATSLSLNVRQPGRPPCPVELTARGFWELPEPVLLVFARNRAYERRLERQLASTHRLSVLGKLFHGTAHDVNNVLATILAWSQWLERESLPDSAREPMRLIEQAAADGAHMVRRALDLARGRRRDHVQTVDLAGVVADALAMCHSRTRTPDGRIHVERRLAQSSLVRGNPAELRELLLNLILNAIEAMPHGGRLAATTQCDADNVYLTVADTGCGMDAAVRQRMFEPFFTTKGHQGTGLGMALVRQIVGRHRATIDVNSEPGRGTTVRLTFTRTGAPPRERSPAPAVPTTHARRTGRVLLVDDQEALQRVVQDILMRAGHNVRATDNGRQALTACTRREYDCLIIDLHMPGVDGWQLASQARHLDPDVALVMLSGSAEAAGPPRKPFDFSVPKPFDLDQLLAVVGEAVALAVGRRAHHGAVAQPTGVKSPASGT